MRRIIIILALLLSGCASYNGYDREQCNLALQHVDSIYVRKYSDELTRLKDLDWANRKVEQFCK